MPPTHNDLLAFMDAKRAESDKTRHAQAVVYAEQGRRAHMLMDHPGWQLFVAEVEQMREQLAIARDAAAKELLVGVAVGDALTAQKTEARVLQGALNTCDKILDLIPSIITRAQDSVAVSADR